MSVDNDESDETTGSMASEHSTLDATVVVNIPVDMPEPVPYEPVMTTSAIARVEDADVISDDGFWAVCCNKTCKKWRYTGLGDYSRRKFYCRLILSPSFLSPMKCSDPGEIASENSE